MSTPAAAAPYPGPVRVLGRVPWHPVLLAVWPGLTMWAANVGEVLPGEVWPALWQPTVAAAGVWLVGSLVLRSPARGAIVASVAAAAVLNAGRVTGGAPGTAAVVVTVVVVAIGAVLAWRLPRTTVLPVTTVLNVLAATMVLLALPPVLSTWGPGTGALAARPAEADAGGLAGRDIWYIIPDRYPREDTLAEVFDHDNTPFLSRLEDKGFQVADRALANYPKTAHSLAATWNLAPVDELVPQPPADGGDWQPLYALLRDHRLGRILTDVGYEHVVLGTWWSPTATAATADRVLRVDTSSEFVAVWRTQTLLPALLADEEDEDDGDLSLRERNRRYSSYQLDELDRLARQRSRQPRFIQAHVTIPHEPYVFDADGSMVTAEQARSRGRTANVTNQVTYLNSRLTDLVDTLLSGPPATWPVIVIQSDEGPHPAARTGPSYDWTSAPDHVLAEKLRTLSAILLPGSDVELPEDLTGVDTWRYVLDAAIGTDFGPLADPPIQVFPDEDHLYDLVDVRDRVD